MFVVASSLEDKFIVAEKVNEKFGKVMVEQWNELMFWTHKSTYHLYLLPDEAKEEFKGDLTE